jgi:hypothetical protein
MFNEEGNTTMNGKQNTKEGKVNSLKAKLVEIMADLGIVEKKGRNPHFGYTYVSEAQLIAELRGRLASHGVLFTTDVKELRCHYGATPKEGVFAEVQTVHTFHDTATDEMIVVGGAGVGWDSGDKGVYKAITGATKYALMKNFMVTDEQDPEAGDQRGVSSSSRKSANDGHAPTREYEQEPSESPKAATDLLELKAFLTESRVPEAFLLAMLKEKKLVSPQLKHIANAPPGVIRRCLSPKSKENLVIAYKNSGDVNATEKRKTAANDRDLDQTRMEIRQPVDPEMDVADILAQEGHDNWRTVRVHFGKQRGEALGELTAKSLVWWITTWKPEKFRGRFQEKDVLLDAALCLAHAEMAEVEARQKGGE